MTTTAGLTETLLRPLLATDPRRPRLTWYGGEPAGRTELSTASLANWAAKTAGLLTDEIGVAPGGLIRVLGVRSWQLLPAALGGWWAGLAVDLGTDGGFADAVMAAPDTDPEVAAAQLGDADPDTYLTLTDHPLALPSGDGPAGARDFSLAVRAHADRFAGVPVASSATALRSGLPWGPAGAAALTVAEALTRARELSAGWAAQPRVLMTLTDTTGASELLAAAVAALAVDGSLVVVDPAGGFEAGSVIADEHVTVPTPF